MRLARPVPSFIVSRSTAMRDPTRHQFIPGLGHVAHEDEPELPRNARPGRPCVPAAGAADRSSHLLDPPNGGRPVVLLWLPLDRAWLGIKPDAGNRLAWTADFLSRAGWAYKGPAPAIIMPGTS